MNFWCMYIIATGLFNYELMTGVEVSVSRVFALILCLCSSKPSSGAIALNIHIPTPG